MGFEEQEWGDLTMILLSMHYEVQDERQRA